MPGLKTLDKAFLTERKTRQQTQPLALLSSRFAWDQFILWRRVLQSIFQIFLFEFLHEGLDFRARIANESGGHFALAIFFARVRQVTSGVTVGSNFFALNESLHLTTE